MTKLMIMKKVLFMAAMAAIFAACNEVGNSTSSNQERDSLQNVIDSKENEINDLMDAFNEIQQGFDLINEAEGRVNLMKDNAENNNIVENIRENMTFIQETLLNNKRKIAELQNKLNNSSINSSKLKEAIASLTNQLNKKNEEVEFN